MIFIGTSSCVFENTVSSAILERSVYIFQLGPLVDVVQVYSVLADFVLFHKLVTQECRSLTSTNVDLSISSFISLSFCSMCFEVLYKVHVHLLPLYLLAKLICFFFSFTVFQFLKLFLFLNIKKYILYYIIITSKALF